VHVLVLSVFFACDNYINRCLWADKLLRISIVIIIIIIIIIIRKRGSVVG
jgi:hypothetical protein